MDQIADTPLDQIADTPLKEIVKELLALPSVMYEARTDHALILAQKLAAERALWEREADLLDQGKSAGITGKSEKDREKQLRGLTREEHRKVDELTAEVRSSWIELQKHQDRFLAILGIACFRDETFVGRLKMWMSEE